MLSRLVGISRAWDSLINTFPNIVVNHFSTDMSRVLSIYEYELCLKVTTRTECSISILNSNSFMEAVYALNGLQSNAAVLKKAYDEKDKNAFKKLQDTEKFLENLGIKATDLDSLNIVHVAGTKGKGSTCAFVESILRRHGLKTGFFSSPHLVSVNERICINGLPLEKSLFVKYFWEVYNPLQCSLKNGESMPPYFMFLTIMAFYVFLKEQVEVAVMEVGIGGLYDCTNIIKKPVVVGITSLGIDHVNLLGNTLPLIASQKAGIFKPGVPAFTVPQHESAMKVLFEKSKQVNCSLKIAPPLEIYGQNLNLGVPGDIQAVNASLAIILASTWLEKKFNSNLIDQKIAINECQQLNESVFIPMASAFSLDYKFIEGLELCKWPGRCQRIEKDGVTLYLDGAHTKESLKHCTKWFQEAAENEKSKLQSPILRVLLFNCTGMRRAENLMDSLIDVNFDLVIFSPNRKTVMKDSASDQSNFKIDPEDEIHQCVVNKEVWGHLIRSINENIASVASQSNSNAMAHETALRDDNSLLFCCLSNAVDWLVFKKPVSHCLLCDKSNEYLHVLFEASHIQVLVTGSLHLVGGVMALVET